MRLGILLLGLFGCILTACVNDLADVKALTEEPNFKQEVAKDVRIFYSDSAQVKVIINAPTLRRFKEKSIINDEFPDGVLVEFMDDNGNVTSWLEADYAIKASADKEVTVKENVKFYNTEDDKLETSKLIWNESDGTVYTDKFVKISQPSRRDTSYGYGLITDEKFSKFEILQFHGVKNAEQLKKNL